MLIFQQTTANTQLCLFSAGPLCTHIPTYPDTTYTVDDSTSCWQVDYTCSSNMVFLDGSTVQTIQCIGGQSLINGSWSGTVLGCAGLCAILYQIETQTLNVLNCLTRMLRF